MMLRWSGGVALSAVEWACRLHSWHLKTNESDAKTPRTPKALRAKSAGAPVLFREAFGVRTRPRVAFDRFTCAF